MNDNSDGPRSPLVGSFVDRMESSRTPPSPVQRVLRRVRTLDLWNLTPQRAHSTSEEREWTIFGELLRLNERDVPVSASSFSSAGSMRDRQARLASPGFTSDTFSDTESSSTIRARSYARGPQVAPPEPFTSSDHGPNEEPVLGRHPHSFIRGRSKDIIGRSWKSWFLACLSPPRLHKSIIKCVLAYWIASLFTFSPSLSALASNIVPGNSSMGPSPSAHMVATIVVLYSPANTAGAMVEANIFCLTTALFASLACLGAMQGFWILRDHQVLEWLADVLALLWIAAATSFIAWIKLWMSKPSFNPGCSNAVVILFVVTIKEGGVQSLLNVLFVVLLGVFLSNAICFLIWPESAVSRLQMDMSTSLKSLSDLLQIITQSFLRGSDSTTSQNSISDVISGHQAVFTKLKSGLDEARSEWLDPRIGNCLPYETAVDCFAHLAQHMTGLRDGAKLQDDLRVYCSAENKSNLDPFQASEATPANAVLVSVERDLSTSLTTLIDSCCRSLESARAAFMPQPAEDTLDFNDMIEDVNRSLSHFASISNHMVLELYRGSKGPESTSRADKARNEAVFHVYFFIFTLQEFAQETTVLLKAIGRIYAIERHLNRVSLFGSAILGQMSQAMTAWCSIPLARYDQKVFTSEGKRPLQKKMSSLLSKEFDQGKAAFPELQPHAPNTQQTPATSSLSVTWKLRRKLWILGGRLKDPQVKYALKTGIATAILAAPAFFDRTRPIFLEYRGEWALVSFFVTIGPTIGATNLLGFQRILGTIAGAYVADVVFSLFPERPILLSILGALFSIPAFYLIIQHPPHAAAARCVLLTYNLTCLYSYSLLRSDVPVDAIAMKRSVTVIIGVVWAFIVSRWWWPLEARRQLGVDLSDFCQQMGWFYSRLVRTYSIPPSILFPRSALPASTNDVPTERSPLMSLAGSSERYDESFGTMERHLQTKLIELEALLAQTEHEPRLKGPFPVKLYRSILTSLQVILDKLHSMRCVTMREEWFTAVHRDFIMPVQRERREMVGNVILYFATLSAAFRLKAPLPPYLPPAEQSRLRLIEAIRAADAGRVSKDSRHLLYYAYASAMHGVIQELERLGATLQDAFGVIGDSTQKFEDLFDNSQLEAAPHP